MKNLSYIFLAAMLLTLCIIPQGAESRSDTVSNRKFFDRSLTKDSSMLLILDVYNKALRTNNPDELFASYSLLCEQCVKCGDYESAKEYALKAIEIDKGLPVRNSISHLFVLLYRSLYEYDPSRVSGFSYVNEAVYRAKSDEDIFEAYICLADYSGRRGLYKTYLHARENYKRYATVENIAKHNVMYNRAESFHHAFLNDIDSAVIVLNKIKNKIQRVSSISSIYRTTHRWDMAMRYADSTDLYHRQESNYDLTHNATQIEALVEKSNLEYARYTENYEIALAQAEIRKSMLLREQLLLESERAENQAKHLEQKNRERMYAMRLDSARVKQQNIEISHREVENGIKAMEEERMQITIGIIILSVVCVVLGMVALFMWLWARSGNRMTANMRALNARQEKLREEAVNASKGRDSFIKNMSEEMQIPLRQVTEYSRILADPNTTLTDDERMEYGVLVQEKSQKIIDHINSILNPDEYVTDEDRESEEVRIEAARKKYQAMMTVVFLFLLLSSVSYANRSALSTFFSKSTVTKETISVHEDRKGEKKKINEADSFVLGLAEELAVVDKPLKRYVHDVQMEAYMVNYQPKMLQPIINKNVKKAVAAKDTLGHCLLLCIQMRSYKLHGTLQEFHIAEDALKTEAKKYGIDRFYYYAYKEEIERYLRDKDFFHALRILDFLDKEKVKGNKTAEFYEYFSRMMISRERDEPSGVTQWAEKVLELNKELKIKQDYSQVFIEIFRSTKNAVYSQYGDSLLNMALKTANNDYARLVAYLEKAFRAGTNQDSLLYYSCMAQADSLKKMIPVYIPREYIARAYHWVFQGDIAKALKIMTLEENRITRYRLQLALARRFKLYHSALMIRDSLVVTRAEETSRVMRTDLLVLRQMYGTDSLAKSLAHARSVAIQLEEQQNQIALQEQKLLLEKEQRKLMLRKAQMEDFSKQRDLQLQKAELESQRIALNTQAARALADKVEAEKRRLMLYVVGVIIAVCTIAGAIFMLYAWRLRNQRQYKKLAQKNKEISLARAEAITATERKDLFIQNMSHEIRTPLNAIAGFAQLLALPEDTFTVEEREKFAQHVAHNSNLLSMLIDDIVNMGNLERGTYTIENKNTNLSDMTLVAMGTVEYRVPAGVKMIYKSAVPDDFMLYTDGRRVVQVLINYLTNAIKHTVEGSITLSVRHTTINNIPMLRFTVADTGTGVPPEQRERIFMRFVKLEKFVQGTGLGLSICRIIAEKMNGRCYLDIRYPKDTPGINHGARFIFEIPVLEPREGVTIE